MISQTVDYVLRAVLALAQRHGASCTAGEISLATGVPQAYLSKIMQGLVRTGLVRSRRGRRGGFFLTQEPSNVTLWDVVHSVEPLRPRRECPLRLPSHEKEICPLHRKLDEAALAVETIFRETTLADLLVGPTGVTPLQQTDALSETTAKPRPSN